MLRRWPKCRGVSRTIKTSRRRSFSTTSAARVNRDEVTPEVISPRVRMEQGASNMPSVRKEPLATDAPTLRTGCHSSARARIESTVRSSSWCTVNSADLLIIRCVSTGSGCNSSSARTPYCTPDAPLMPIISRSIVTASSYRVTTVYRFFTTLPNTPTPRHAYGRVKPNGAQRKCGFNSVNGTSHPNFRVIDSRLLGAKFSWPASPSIASP